MNGWKNRETWNVVTWINNDESLYRFAARYSEISANPSYRQLIELLGYEDSRTHDGVDWISDELDYEALDEMVVELAN